MYTYNYRTWIHTIIKQSLTDLYNYMSENIYVYIHLYDCIYV